MTQQVVIEEIRLLRERLAMTESALRKIVGLEDGDVEDTGDESDAVVFARALDFVRAHAIARAALAADTEKGE